MPIYEYECECGAQLETLDAVGTTRTVCGDLCRKRETETGRGHGAVRKLFSVAGIRGDGRQAVEKPCHDFARRTRPGCENCECNLASFSPDE